LERRVEREPIWIHIYYAIENLSRHNINKVEAVNQILHCVVDATEEEKTKIREAKYDYNNLYPNVFYMDFLGGGEKR